MSTPQVRAAVVVTGDEVLGGRVVEQNGAYLARDLAARGVPLVSTLIVGDRRTQIAAAVRALVADGIELICVTGGLGPTYDDLTMQAVADATERPLALDEVALGLVVERSRGVRRHMQIEDAELDAMRRKQATLPRGCVVLSPIGTAPGCVVTHAGSLIVVLPGPPGEAQPMWQQAVGQPPLAQLLAPVAATPARILRLWGVVEAELMTALNTLAEDDLAAIGTYTRAGELEVVTPQRLADPVARLLEDRFPGALFAHDGEQVEAIIAQALTARGERLAVAESCTGGGLGARLTSLPGASAWFLGGVIAYDNAVKERVLGVTAQVLTTAGAVSEPSAVMMAEGVRALTGADWGVSITGVAGPGGGTADKPVGFVCIAVAGAHPSVASIRFWSGEREAIRLRAQTAALHHLRRALHS